MPSFDLTLLIPLLVAHLLTDFTLQSDAMARSKQRLPTLLLHLLITGIVAYLLLGDFREWRIPIVILSTHGVIDLLKARFGSRPQRELPAFLIDQFAHLAVIFAISAYNGPLSGLIQPWWLEHNPESYLKALLFIGGTIAVTQAAGVFIAKLLPRMLETTPDLLSTQSGFAKAGRYIGYLERLLLFLFVLTGQLAAAGFLIAAKSVFRFQKLDEDRRQTEYILLGTLLSFTTGIALSYAVKALLV